MKSWSPKWASQMTDEELIAEFVMVDLEVDEMQRAHSDPDFEGYGGSPGEGLYERVNELGAEMGRRGLSCQRDLLFNGDRLLEEWRTHA